MSASRLKDVVTKVLAQIGMLPVEELPSLVYQLLLLSARGAWRVVRGARCVGRGAWWCVVRVAWCLIDGVRDTIFTRGLWTPLYVLIVCVTESPAIRQ